MDKLSLDERVMQFVAAPDWHTSESIVLEYPELLGDDAQKTLQAMREVATAISDSHLVRCIAAHAAILGRCRKVDVATAFKEIRCAPSGYPDWLPADIVGLASASPNAAAPALSARGKPGAGVADRAAPLKIDAVRSRYCEALDVLATALRNRYRQTGNRNDLAVARRMHLSAVNLFQVPSARLAELFDGLGLDLSLQYALTATADDLNGAIVAWEAAVKLPAPSSEFAADYRINLASMLRLRFARDGNQVDIERAITYYREALATIPAESQRHAYVLSCIQEAERERARREPSE